MSDLAHNRVDIYGRMAREGFYIERNAIQTPTYAALSQVCEDVVNFADRSVINEIDVRGPAGTNFTDSARVKLVTQHRTRNTEELSEVRLGDLLFAIRNDRSLRGVRRVRVVGVEKHVSQGGEGYLSYRFDDGEPDVFKNDQERIYAIAEREAGIPEGSLSRPFSAPDMRVAYVPDVKRVGIDENYEEATLASEAFEEIAGIMHSALPFYVMLGRVS